MKLRQTKLSTQAKVERQVNTLIQRRFDKRMYTVSPGVVLLHLTRRDVPLNRVPFTVKFCDRVSFSDKDFATGYYN